MKDNTKFNKILDDLKKVDSMSSKSFDWSLFQYFQLLGIKKVRVAGCGMYVEASSDVLDISNGYCYFDFDSDGGVILIDGGSHPILTQEGVYCDTAKVLSRDDVLSALAMFILVASDGGLDSIVYLADDGHVKPRDVELFYDFYIKRYSGMEISEEKVDDVDEKECDDSSNAVIVNGCDTCTHSEVCAYSKSYRDLSGTVNKYKDFPFVVSVSCKYYNI